MLPLPRFGSRSPIARLAATLLALTACAGIAGDAAAQKGKAYTEITGSGQTLVRMAIPAVLDGGAAGSAVGTLHAVMVKDMTLIGLFKVVDAKAFLADLQREGTGIEPARWAAVGAQSVIKAQARKRAGKLEVDFLLYDVGRGDKPVLQKRYSGGSARRLAHRFGDDVVHHFTGERGIFTTRIAFTARGGAASQIYAMDYDGHGVHRVSRTGRFNLLPAWSRGGGLAWTSYLWGNPDLYVASSAGGRARRISRRPGLNAGAAFSPDGNSIALTLTKDGNSEIYVISASSGAVLRRLTRNGAIDASPSWSPDGSKIAFVSNRGGTAQIYVMPAAGGAAKRLTYKGGYNQEPAWCPRKGSSLIAYTAMTASGYDIFTIDAKTGELKRLTQGQGSNLNPSWAPSGRLITFRSSRGGLWLMTAEGFNQSRVYRGYGLTPRWSY